MATIVTIHKGDSKEVIDKKLKDLNSHSVNSAKKFPASKFTGAIKSYGDGVAYQGKMRNEWD